MKIFISYAHVDQYRVRELVEILRASGHEPWFDQGLTVGRAWEAQLLEQIRACDRFVYALTPESVKSAWCRWEFAQAVHAGKPVLPVLVQANTDLNGIFDGILGRIQFADFSRGPDPLAVAKLLGGVFSAETVDPALVPLMDPPHAQPERPIEHAAAPRSLADRFVEDAYTAFRAQNYAEVRDLLRDCLDIEPEHAEAQKLRAVVERRIADAIKRETAALTRATRRILPAPFEWVHIPAGRVEIEGHGWFDVEAFRIAKYPVTNAQFAKFVEAGGYEDKQWWTTAGWERRTEREWTEPRYWHDDKWNGAEYPVVGVSWHEALAFCRWLSAQTGEEVTLPTEQQWQRAAQGDDGREYPWGDEFDAAKCNTHESGIGQTTPVTRYPNGASPYGVLDMAGNVWEWCLNPYDDPHSVDAAGDARRVLRGGSWFNGARLARAAYRGLNAPTDRYYGVGFRVLRPPSRS